MTKKDYILIADVLREFKKTKSTKNIAMTGYYAITTRYITDLFIKKISKENPIFDGKKFIKYIEKA